MKLIIVSMLFLFNAYADHPILLGPEKVGRSDSGIHGPSYEEMKAQLIALSAVNPTITEILHLGESEDGTETLGILIGRKDRTLTKFVMMSGSTHGNEYLGIVDKLPKAFLNPENQTFYNFYDQGGAIVVVPVINPYGYEERSRYNLNRKDLNRDFSNLVTGVTRFTQAETRNIKDWVAGFTERSGAVLKASVDYHCCYGGALLFPWAYTKEIVLSDEELAKHNDVALLLDEQFPGTTYGPTGEVLWYTADGTSKDYWHAKYGAAAFTYEGRYSSEVEFLDEHISWWRGIVGLYLE